MVQFSFAAGDYDLKVMRQEYYINRQKAVSFTLFLIMCSFCS